MTGHPRAIALIRTLNAVFFFATSAYCLLAYIPFAYQVFLKPEVLWWMPDFLALHVPVYWLTFLLTALTLKPFLSRTGSRTIARQLALWYVLFGAAIGLVLIVKPVMGSVDNTPRSLAISLIALTPVIWLAAFDHAAAPSAAVGLSDERRVLAASVSAAFCAWAAYAIGSPIRLRHVAGIDLPVGGWWASAGLSGVMHLFVFAAVFLALVSVRRAAGLTRLGGKLEYALLVAMAGGISARVLYSLVFTSLTFVGAGAAAAASMMGLTIAFAWSGIARWQGRAARAQWTALELFLSPVGYRNAGTAWSAVVLLPFIAYGLTAASSRMDWNFIVQKLGVLAVWLLAFGACSALSNRLRVVPGRAALAVVPLLALGLFQGAEVAIAHSGAALDAESVFDRYAALDLSFRLIRDERQPQSQDTAEFYARLKSNTLVAPPRIKPYDIQFAPRVLRPSKRPPHIFLFVVDSLRRDYVSTYNPAVTFTPAIGRFASESFVFRRAFTRYGGTGLAVPSIWAGGMLMHMIDQRPFDGRDSLLKLIDGLGYRPIIGVDSVLRDLIPEHSNIVELDKGVPSMECDFCRTLGELRTRLDASDGDPRPVFSYTLPQNVHIAVAARHRVPSDRTYPGFFAPVADTVRDIDRCFGEFIEFLRQTNRYDDSIVILTADHGDSLGEEGRWGHGYFMVPEVMRVPLLIRLPPALRERVATDLGRVAFTTDLAPTLYALTGNAAAGLGPLFGSPLFVERGTDLMARRHESFVLASSYGAVYGMLRHNGRKLYAADAVDGRDDAYDMSGDLKDRRIAITQGMLSLNRRLITEQLDTLAALNHYNVKP
jgi:hypothetical protein